jgi:hypothetical protein
MGLPVNLNPRPERDTAAGIETLRWPLRLDTAKVVLTATNEDGEQVRLTATLAFPHPDSACITEISRINEDYLRVDPTSEYLLDLHGRLVPDPTTGSVYTVEVQ